MLVVLTVAPAVGLLGLSARSARAAGPYALFLVPGVVSAGDLATLFGCSSTDTATQTVTVDVFDRLGTLAETGNFSLPANGTVLFGTKTPQGFAIDVDLGAVTVTRGLAKISSTSKKLTGSAFIADATNLTPTFGVGLQVIKGTKQKGD